MSFFLIKETVYIALYNTVCFVLFPVCATVIFGYFVVVVKVYDM
jgi:hypothetical protein